MFVSICLLCEYHTERNRSVKALFFFVCVYLCAWQQAHVYTHQYVHRSLPHTVGHVEMFVEGFGVYCSEKGNLLPVCVSAQFGFRLGGD